MRAPGGLARSAILGLVGIAALATAPPGAAAAELQAVGPPDGAPLFLDRPTTFAILDTPLCEPEGPHPPGTPAPAILVFSTSPQVDADGYVSVVTDFFGMHNAGNGQHQYVYDPRPTRFVTLPAAGTPLWWQAGCIPPSSIWPSPTVPKRLTVVPGSRVKPPTSDEIGVTLNNGAVYTNDPNVQLKVAAPEFSEQARVSNDGGFRAAQTLGVPPHYRPTFPWVLQSSGPERLPKTVYVRFSTTIEIFPGSGYPAVDPTKTHTDDIILDETPPKILSATAGGGVASVGASAARKRSVRLRIRARDRTSGVKQMQITNSKRKPGKLRKFKRSTNYKTGGGSIFVRVRDGAGNFSKWRKAGRG